MAHLIAAALGAFFWTVMEYVLHRWAGHEARGKIDFSREHLAHHRDNTYFAANSKKALSTAVFVLPIGALSVWLTGLVGVTFTVAFTLTYVAYEWLHRSIHVRAPRTFYGRWACRHHLFHHHKSPWKNHGVTVPIWDWVFRTYVPVEHIKVPSKNVMPWLIDEAGEVLDAYRETYSVGRRKVAPGAA